MRKIPFMLFRGGTSKGPFFLKEDLPSDETERDNLLMDLLGSGHSLEIDGIGGGNPLTSKLGILTKSQRDGVDVDYLTSQVHVNERIIESNIDCGNILSAAVCFAIERNLVKATNPETIFTLYSENSKKLLRATVQTPNGKITYKGDHVIDGAPGSGSPIKITFLDVGGSKSGKILPTGNPIDIIDGIAVSCVEMTMPMVIVEAMEFGLTGYETKAEIDKNHKVIDKIEALRHKAAKLMNLGDVTHKMTPKICLIAEPKSGGTITARYFIAPFNYNCHPTMAISGSLVLSAASFIEGTIANELTDLSVMEGPQLIEIEHPSGKIPIEITIERDDDDYKVPEVSYFRTARLLIDGHVFLNN